MRTVSCSLTNLWEMNKEIKAVLRDATVVYLTNSDVNVLPSIKEHGRQVMNHPTNRKGRMTVAIDGSSHFQAYRQGTGSRYEWLMETANGELKRTQRMLIVRLAIPIGIGRIRIIETICQQMKEIVNYIKLVLKTKE